MSVYQGNVTRMGQRLIAQQLGLSKNTVTAAIRELAQRGHVAVDGSGKAARWYQLTSPVFASKQRAGVEEVVARPGGARRLVSVRKAE